MRAFAKMFAGFHYSVFHNSISVYYLVPLLLGKLNTRWNELAPFALAYESRATNQDEISEKIRKFYMKDELMTFWNREDWTRVIGDRAAVQSVFYGMQHHSRIAPTYGYVFSYRSNLMSVFNTMGLNSKDWGVGHVDELLYMFNNSLFDHVSRRNEDDYRMS